MAQIVKIEAGDILVLANLGDDGLGNLQPAARCLEEATGAAVYLFAGDVDLSAIPAETLRELAGA